MRTTVFEKLLIPIDSDSSGIGSGGDGITSSDDGGMTSSNDGITASNDGGITSSDNGSILSDGGGVTSAPAGAAVAFAAPAHVDVPDPNMRRSDVTVLHPRMRAAIAQLTASFASEGLPFRVFEAFRTPVRQHWLYAQGRTRPGGIVTKADSWQSYHQYGLAADFVLWIDNSWSWDTAGSHARVWRRLHELGATLGLEPLSFEMPHLQIAGLKLADLRNGIYPAGGDDAWRDNLEAAIVSWTGSPAAPPVSSLRPPLPAHALGIT